MANNPMESERVRQNIDGMKALLVNENAAAAGVPGSCSFKHSFSFILIELVNCEHFGEILDWFGPIGHPDTTTPNDTVLDHIRDILRQPYECL